VAPTLETKSSIADYYADVNIGRSYKLYTHSYLNYGLDAVQEMFQHTRSVVDRVEEAGNPCYPKAYRHSAIGDYDGCVSMLNTAVIDKNTPCAFGSCSFNGIYQPQLQSEGFLAIENFFWTTKFFSIHHAEDAELLDRFKRKGRDFCSRDWRNLTQEFKSEGPTDLSRYCFASAYMPLLLQRGFGLLDDVDGDGKPDNEVNIKVVREIHGRPVDWELGAALLEILANRQGTQPGSGQQMQPHAGLFSNNDRTGPTALANAVIWVSIAAVPLFALWVLCRRICGAKRVTLV
jgi:apyrase